MLTECGGSIVEAQLRTRWAIRWAERSDVRPHTRVHELRGTRGTPRNQAHSKESRVDCLLVHTREVASSILGRRETWSSSRGPRGSFGNGSEAARVSTRSLAIVVLGIRVRGTRARRGGGHRKLGFEAHGVLNGLPSLRSPGRSLPRSAGRSSGPGRQPPSGNFMPRIDTDGVGDGCGALRDSGAVGRRSKLTSQIVGAGVARPALPAHAPRRVEWRSGRDAGARRTQAARARARTEREVIR